MSTASHATFRLRRPRPNDSIDETTIGKISGKNGLKSPPVNASVPDCKSSMATSVR
jgi:hypothetical protein